MAQILFGSNASPSLPNLDLNFTDNYDWREMVKSSGYASPSAAKFDATSGAFLLTTAQGVGYGTGSGGTVTQATSKATAVTLNKPSGSILMNAASLATLTTVQFGVNNSLVAATDVVIINVTMANGVAGGNNYTATVYGTTAGQFSVRIRNDSGGPLAETVLLNFAVIKAVVS